METATRTAAAATALAGKPRRSLPPGPPARSRGLVSRVRYFANFLIDPLGFIAGRFERYGDVYYAPSADEGLFVVKHPDHLHEVLVQNASAYRKKHSAFEQLGQVLGQGLLNTDGEVWKRQRRMVQPAFSRSRLDEYAATMADEAVRTGRQWSPGEERDMGREMMEATLRIVARTLFSHDASGDRDDVARAMGTFQNAMVGLDLIPEWLPSPGRRRLERANAALDRIIYGMIESRRAAMGRGDEVPSDLLQRLLEVQDEEGDGGGLSEREVRDQLVTLFLAGHETTAHALTWTWYLLSQSPEAERRLHAELDEVLGGRTPTYEDLERLPYADQVVKEAMRLYPPVYLVARRAAEDTTIGGYDVAAGDEVVCWIYMTHHDSRWWPEPEAFRPERFEPGAEEGRPRLAWAPFGAGPRACIGKSFAMIEARLVLATLASRWRPRLAPGQRVGMRPRITLNPRWGMRMVLEPRG